MLVSLNPLTPPAPDKVIASFDYEHPVFDAGSGSLLRTLNNPTPATGDCFGISVAVTGSTVVVGAYSDDTGATNSGSAYLFDAATERRLTA